MMARDSPTWPLSRTWLLTKVSMAVGSKDRGGWVAGTGSARTAAAPATAAAAAIGLGSGFIDRQSPALNLLAVEGGDGGLRFLIAAHLDEAEPLGSPGVAVHDHLG